MTFPVDNENRTHAEVRQDCINFQEKLIESIYDAHDSIKGFTYSGSCRPRWTDTAQGCVTRFRLQLREYEESDLLKVYFSRATDGGVGGRKNISLIHQALENYALEVTRAESFYPTESSMRVGHRDSNNDRVAGSLADRIGMQVADLIPTNLSGKSHDYGRFIGDKVGGRRRR